MHIDAEIIKLKGLCQCSVGEGRRRCACSFGTSNQTAVASPHAGRQIGNFPRRFHRTSKRDTTEIIQKALCGIAFDTVRNAVGFVSQRADKLCKIFCNAFIVLLIHLSLSFFLF